jgi:hypothetical protein
LGLQAQKVTFTASSQNVVAVGEQFRLNYKLNNRGSNFQAPNLKGFRVLAGPNASNSSSISIVNGQMTKEISTTYSYVLQAVKEGKYKITPAKITVNDKTYNSNTLKIEVVKGGAKANQNTGNSQNNQAGVSEKDLFIKISPNKRKVFLGEPIALTLKVYTRVDLADLQNAEFPEYKGFYSQDIKTPDNITLQRENINGVIYNTALLDKVLLYPQRTGKLKIESAKIDAIIRKKVQKRGRRNVFDDFFGGGYQQFRVPLKSKSITIDVKELPSNKPASFTGAVGSFTVNAEIDNTELKVNDALTFKIKISGKGNIKLIKDPELEFPHDFDVWEPKVNNKITNTTSGTKGSKIYEYVIQPRHPGNFTIPAFEFSYFDVNSKKYKTISTKTFDIKVGEGDGTSVVVNSGNYSKEDVELIGKDIRYIKTGDLHLSAKSEPFFGSLNYWLSYLIGILVFVIIFILRRKQIKDASDSVLMKNRKAKKEAIKRMKLAKTYLGKNQSEQFYEEIVKGIQGYLSDKLNIPLSELSLETAIVELQKKEVSTELLDKLKATIQECEFARYAPSQANQNLNEIYSASIKLISDFEDSIKK